MALAAGTATGAREPRSRWLGALALFFFGAVGCGGEEPAPTRALHELERLTFVASARCQLGDDTDLSIPRALVFDRFEVTRDDFKHYFGARAREGREGFVSEAALDRPGRGDWPAYLTFHEAAELAEMRRMRLPKPHEWLHVAVGRRDYQQPWGGAGRKYFANTWIQDPAGRDFSLDLPTRVGTYENGVSRPFGCYDLLGNVWEWVDGVVKGTGSDDVDDHGGTRASILGGGYDSPWQEMHVLKDGRRFHARLMHKSELAPWIGARMCAEAGEYLWSRAGDWGSGAAAEARVRGVARRWAESDALARAELRLLLAELAARPGAAPGIRWLAQGLAEAR